MWCITSLYNPPVWIGASSPALAGGSLSVCLAELWFPQPLGSCTRPFGVFLYAFCPSFLREVLSLGSKVWELATPALRLCAAAAGPGGVKLHLLLASSLKRAHGFPERPPGHRRGAGEAGTGKGVGGTSGFRLRAGFFFFFAGCADFAMALFCGSPAKLAYGMNAQFGELYSCTSVSVFFCLFVLGGIQFKTLLKTNAMFSKHFLLT